MRIMVFMIVSALVTTSAWARVGETIEQAELRYGTRVAKGTIHEDIDTVSVQYRKGGMSIMAEFFQNSAGVPVIGQIEYLPIEDAANTEEALQKVIDANANGEVWNKVESMMHDEEYRRNGATAVIETVVTFSAFTSHRLTVTLDEYTESTKRAKVESERKREEMLEKERSDF